ncbi:hypothetical protein AGMMS4952_26070 [Spirochaetia bacterium]|nr:hypothetical protein AGMMS4952_26070 [Spirochaetia bacterium]
MEYRFNGKMTLDDFVQYNRFYTVDIFFKRKISIIFYITPLVLIGLVIYKIIIHETIYFLDDLLGILIYCLFIFFIVKKPKGLFKKPFNSNKMSQEEQYFVINEKEIIITTESMNIKLIKEKINKIKFDKDTIYLFTSEGSAYLIKSRYLNNFKELKEFIKINYM